MPPLQRCRHRQSQHSVLTAAQARGHGLWPAAIQQYVALICRLMVSTTELSTKYGVLSLLVLVLLEILSERNQ